MGAIAGIWSRNGRPLSPAHIATIHRENTLGLDATGGKVLPLPQLMLSAHIRPFDSLSARERQPLSFNSIVATWDGRLDNRTDLLLTLRRSVKDDVTDVALVAAAYARWGLDAWPRLIGDWSVAIWDKSEARLVLARDYIGNRPLFYCDLGDTISWATHRDVLATCFGLYNDVDDEYIVGHLTHGVPRGHTSLRSVRALLAGHCLVATSHGTTVRRYWSFNPDRIHYRDPRQYGEHLRHLISEAVRVRLRADRTVWVHLSGGWDSSSLVCIADELVRQGAVEAPAIQPVSRVRTQAPESEERRYQHAVAEWCELSCVFCETPQLPTFQELLLSRHPFLFGRCNADRGVQEAVSRQGDYILMTGEGGDIVMQRNAARVALIEPLLEGDLRRFFGVCAARAEAKQRATIAVLAGLAVECLPSSLRHAMGRLIASMTAHGEMLTTHPALEAVHAAASRKNSRKPYRQFRFSKRAMVQLCDSYSQSVAGNSDLMPTVWYTHPYTHRPLVEFALAVPQLALWHPSIYRLGMQRALVDVLPPAILARRNKGGLGTWFARTDREQIDGFLSLGGVPQEPGDWLLVQRGYLNASHVARALAAAKSGTEAPTTAIINKWVVLEAWLRQQAVPSAIRETRHQFIGGSSPREVTTVAPEL